MGEIKKSWNGQEKLWRVFWIYNFLLGTLINLLNEQVNKLVNDYLFWSLAVLTLVWIVWVVVSLWRCAFNCNWKGWGYIVRALLIGCAIAVCFSVAGFVNIR